MEILIRNLSEDDGRVLDMKAKAAGYQSRGDWLADQIKHMAIIPERYTFRVYGQSGGKGAVRRYSDHVNGTSTTFSNFSQDEASTMERAENLIRRNGIGDKEQAYKLLVEQFGTDQVFEVPA